MAPKHSEFIPLKIAVLTVSDSRTAADDSSGDYLVEALTQTGHVLADRALNGVQETVFYHGEEIATRTRYDARLLLAHLARLDRIEASHQVHKVAAEFEERVALLLDPPVVMAWDDEDYEEYDEDDWADEGEGEAAEGDEDAEEDLDAFIARLRGNTP